MYANEVVMHEVEGNSMALVIDFLRECVCEPGEAAHLHSHSEILAFNITGRDMLWVWVSRDSGSLYREAYSGAIASLFAYRGAIQLMQGSEVNVKAERAVDSYDVRSQAVCGELNPAVNASGQIFHEGDGASSIATGDKVGRTQFGVSVDSDPRPHIAVAELPFLLSRHVLFLRVAEVPNLVTLYALALEPAHGTVVELSAHRSDLFQQRENRSLRDASHAAGSADGVALGKGCHNGNLLEER